MKKYLKDLENELKKLKVSAEDIKEILEDHKEMINEALNDGVTEDELTSKFGTPSILAKDLSEDVKAVNVNINEYSNESQFDVIEGFKLHKTFPVVDLDEIFIKLVSANVEVYPYNGEQIEVHFKNVKDPEQYVITFKNGVFQLKRKKSIVRFSIKVSSESIVVRYPIQTKLNTYTVDTVSGDCVVKGIISTMLKLKTVSGDCEITGAISGKTELSTVSGDFRLLDMEVEEVAMSAVSGDFNVKDLKVDGDIDLNTVSGDYDCYNVSGDKATFGSVSGDLDAKEFYVNTVNLKSISGDITIVNEDKTRPINVEKKKTLSGDITIR